MSKAASFLEAILTDPDDDAVRLIYADWLEEQGDDAGVPAAREHAEFIRLQIALSRLPTRDTRRKDKEEREKMLLREYASVWFTFPSGWIDGVNVSVARGFPFAVSQTARSLHIHGESLFARWPITRLQLTYVGDVKVAKSLVALPFLTRIRELDLYCCRTGPEVFRVLVKSPCFANVTWLNARSNVLGNKGMRHLARSPYFASLQELDLQENGIGSVGLRELIKSKQRRTLRSLNLSRNFVPGDDIAALLESDNWPALATLTLESSQLTDEDLERVAVSPGLSKLSTLNLKDNQIGDRSLRALAASPHAVNLRTLNLENNMLSWRSTEVLIGSPSLQGLTALHLGRNRRFESEHIGHLRDHFGDRLTFDEPQ
jgi:uncharacterized protein (TIGR02996 family)